MASMKPHHSEGQLHKALVLVIDEVLVEVLQLLPPLVTLSVQICLRNTLVSTSSTSASLLLLLFIVGCQHINTRWVNFRKRNKTMP